MKHLLLLSVSFLILLGSDCDEFREDANDNYKEANKYENGQATIAGAYYAKGNMEHLQYVTCLLQQQISKLESKIDKLEKKIDLSAVYDGFIPNQSTTKTPRSTFGTGY